MLYKETNPDQLEMLEQTGKFVSQDKIDGDNFKVYCTERDIYDGKRREIRLINRHENEYTTQFPEIIAGLGVKKGVSCVLNGELAYWSEEKQIYDFNKFRGRQGLQDKRKIMTRRLQYPCKIYVFDLIEYNGINMVNNPHYTFEKRYQILQRIILNNNVTELVPIRTDLVNHFNEECKGNREGIMVKNIDNLYCGGRTNSILKCKNWHFSKVKFTGFEENKNDTITLTNGTDRVLCASRDNIDVVRQTIKQLGYSYEVVRHLQGRSKDSGKIREGTYKEHIGVIEE